MKRYHYWLLCKDEDGKPFLVYGASTEEECRQKGLEMLGAEFEIRRLPTKNLASASQMVKGRTLEETHSLKKASHRLGHDKSVRRMRSRKLKDPYDDLFY